MGANTDTVSNVTVKPFVVTMMVNDISIDMELDSGSPVSLMPKKQFDKHFKSTTLLDW
jgi:hypothetical protein